MIFKSAASMLAALAVAACGATEEPRAVGDGPQRIVSLDYCADQHVVMLADEADILALSPDATAPFSYVRERARGLPTVRARMEDVLLLEPDLVVRSYGGGPGAAALLGRAGVEVLQIPYVSTIEGVFAATIETAGALGHQARGAQLVDDAKRRLAALGGSGGGPDTLYVTSGGATTGPGSLVDEIITAAGLSNFERRPGWRPIDLEALAYEEPELVAAAFFTTSEAPFPWSPVKHPVAQAQLSPDKAVPLDGAWTACGGVFLVEAAEALARGPAAPSSRQERP